MQARVWMGAAALLCVALFGCDDGKIANACGRACVGNERCDVAQGRCVINAPPVISFTLPLADAVQAAATTKLEGTITDDSGLLREAFYKVGDGEWTPLGIEVEGTFSATIALPTADGQPVVISVKASDLDGLEGLGTRTVTVDRVAPECAFVSPAANAVLTGASTTVRVTASDGSGQLGEASLSLDDTTTLRQPLTDGAARFEVPLAMLDGAARRWTLQARDAAGNRCEKSLDVRVDNLGPEVVITQPTAGQSVTRGSGGAVPVAFTVTDGTGVASAEVQAPPSTQWQPATLTGTQGTFAWVVPANDEQVSRTLRVRATDTAGTVGAETSVTVTIDAVAPVCTLLSPTPGQVLAASSGPVFTVAFRVTDGSAMLGGGEVSVDDGATWQPVSLDAMGRGSYPWLLDASANGVMTRVKVRARDAAGNLCPEQSAAVQVDTVGPAITVTAPAANASLRVPSITFSGTAADGAAGAASMTLDFGDGAGPRTIAISGQAWAVAVPTSATDDSVAHTATIRALDAAGNASTTTLPLRVDRVAPTLTVPRPTEGQRLGVGQLVMGSVELEALGADGDPFLVVEAETMPGVFSAVLGGTHLVGTAVTDNDVVYSQVLRARDTAGNVTSLTRTFRVDRVAPSLAFTTPAADAAVGGSAVSFSGTAADGAAPVATLTLDFADGAGARTVPPSGLGWSTSVPTLPGEDFVPHVATLRATDAAGNATTITRQVYVDRVAPRVTVPTPSEGQRFNIAALASPLTLTATVVDGDGQTTLEVDPGGDLWTTLGAGHVVTTAASDDDVEYVRRVRGRDRAGNETIVARRFRVDRVAPTLLATAPTNGQRATTLEFSMQFSEPMTLGAGLPVVLTPSVSGATASVDGTGRLVTVRGLSGNQAYSAQLRPAGLSDLAGNAPLSAAAVAFTTAPRRPANGAVLIDATATRQVEWFRTSADEDGVVSLLVRVVDPTTLQRTWLFGWIDPQTGTFLQQGTLAGGNTGGSITSVADPQANGSVRRRATVRLGGTGTTYLFELGVPGMISSVPFVFGVDPAQGEQAGTDFAAISGALEYQRPPNPAFSFTRSSAESPLQAAVLDRNRWSVLTAQTTGGITSLFMNTRHCSCAPTCGCTELTNWPMLLPVDLRRPDLVSTVKSTVGVVVSTFHTFAEEATAHYPESNVFCNFWPGGSPATNTLLHTFASFISRAGSGAIDVTTPNPLPNFDGTTTITMRRFTDCNPMGASTTTFTVRNPTGVFVAEGPYVYVRENLYGTGANYFPQPGQPTLRLVVPEVSGVPGPTPALLWLEAPGRLRYLE